MSMDNKTKISKENKIKELWQKELKKRSRQNKIYE